MITVNIYLNKNLIGTIKSESDNPDNLIQAVDLKVGADNWDNFEVVKGDQK